MHLGNKGATLRVDPLCRKKRDRTRPKSKLVKRKDEKTVRHLLVRVRDPGPVVMLEDSGPRGCECKYQCRILDGLFSHFLLQISTIGA